MLLVLEVCDQTLLGADPKFANTQFVFDSDMPTMLQTENHAWPVHCAAGFEFDRLDDSGRPFPKVCMLQNDSNVAWVGEASHCVLSILCFAIIHFF